MNTKKKVAVAMSGGVDSSVAAALLKREGYEVFGLTMDLFSLTKNFSGMHAKEDAYSAACALGIEHFVVNLKTEFKKKVIKNFVAEYIKGRTPNPCIRCNQHIKFDALLERAIKLGAEYLATGHYARILYETETDHYDLLRGKDLTKDQSYFLYTMTQQQMKKIMFPLGDLTKEEVRAFARDLKLPVAERIESQEICFIPDNNYARFLKETQPEAFCPGPIVDETGRVLGEHQGVLQYTIGQRRGMGIAAESPLYVIEIQPERNAVVVGKNERLLRKTLLAANIHWINQPDAAGPLYIKARIRYRHREASAKVMVTATGKVRVEFQEPQRAITPGQAVVFYDGDIVLGGGIIQRSI
jgi:tRNA-specific 2-thiouridylase